MSRVLAAGAIIPVEDYEANPEAFGQALERAKAGRGYALCLCTTPNPQLVVRRVSYTSGDRFFMATWPHKGSAHAPTCRFFHSEDEYQKGKAKRLAAVQQSEDGSTIKADFSLRRLKRAPATQDSREWVIGRKSRAAVECKGPHCRYSAHSSTSGATQA